MKINLFGDKQDKNDFITNSVIASVIIFLGVAISLFL
jgi:hypothetical protein